MTTRLVKRLDSTYFVTIDGGCSSCAGCGVGQRKVQLGSDRGDEMRLELPTRVIFTTLFNSLLLPTLSIVVAAMVCSVFSLAEPVAIVVFLFSFLAGLAFCRQQPADLLKVEEVV